MSLHDPLWIRFPRWIEESGVPQYITAVFGFPAWLVFHKLIETECDQNLTPDWFLFSLKDLSRWTGCSEATVETVLQQLESDRWIERTDQSFEVQKARIVTPMEIPEELSHARQGIKKDASVGGNFILRYAQDVSQLNQVEKVVYMYQMIFGARFTPKIAEDLEELANTYDMGVIYDAFSEAYDKKVKSLAWVKSRLSKKIQEEMSAGENG